MAMRRTELAGLRDEHIVGDVARLARPIWQKKWPREATTRP